MNNFGIAKSCSENWDGMTKNDKGAFCQNCSKNVIDFTSMTSSQINLTLLESKGVEICGRIKPQQVQEMNDEFNRWMLQDKRSFQRAFLFSLLVVFGFSLFSCSDNNQKQEIQQIRATVQQIVRQDISQDAIPVAVEQKQISIPEAIPPEVISYVVDFAETPYELPEIIVEAPGTFYLGGMGFSNNYTTYLEETVEITDEYDESGNLIPKAFSALAFPNPFSGKLTLEMKLPFEGDFTIQLMDMNGRMVQMLQQGKIERGTFRLPFDISEQVAGTYLIAIVSKDFKEVVRVVKI